MTSKERVLKTLSFDDPDRIPVDLWVLPVARMTYGKAFDDICKKHEVDIAAVTGPFDHANTNDIYTEGVFVDQWGCQWLNIQPGIIGKVLDTLIDESNIDSYRPPIERFLKEWEEESQLIDNRIQQLRLDGKFITGGWISIFERMQFLRGTEELLCDIAMCEDDDTLDKMINIVMPFMRVYLKKWLEKDVDAICFGDDWGTQISMLVSPDIWRRKFRPAYQELFDMIKQAGKKVFFHSDGYIFDIYQDFIDMGVDAINSQLWCMGVQKVAEKFAGKITFWGEVSRQNTLPYGTPGDVQDSAAIMKELLYIKGGLIGQGEVNGDVPLRNVEALLSAWH